MATTKLWVEYQTPAKTFLDKVSIQGCEDIADFLKEIKKESQLAIPENTPITLYQSDGTTEIRPRSVHDRSSQKIGCHVERNQ